MAAPWPNYTQAEINAVVAAYKTGASYNTVSRELRLSSTSVRSIMHKYAPGSVRTRAQQIMTRVQPKPAVEGLTLAALGLMRVGPCRVCEVPLVARHRENPVKGQTCGLCEEFAGRAA